MIDSAMTAPSNALAAKKAQEKSYRKKGIFIALMSGFLYGGYTAFLTQGMASGIWAIITAEQEWQQEFLHLLSYTLCLR